MKNVDPGKLESALEKAGVPAAIMVGRSPGLGPDQGIECKPDPGVSPPVAVGQGLSRFDSSRRPGSDRQVRLPAGDYITLMRFESHGREAAVGSFGVNVGRQTTCVPEHASFPGKTGK